MGFSKLMLLSLPSIQGRQGEAEARAEVFRLKCKEQREQMGILKREWKQAKKNLKTMELLAEMGKENKEQNAPPQAPQVLTSCPFAFLLCSRRPTAPLTTPSVHCGIAGGVCGLPRNPGARLAAPGGDRQARGAAAPHAGHHCGPDAAARGV